MKDLFAVIVAVVSIVFCCGLVEAGHTLPGRSCNQVCAKVGGVKDERTERL